MEGQVRTEAIRIQHSLLLMALPLLSRGKLPDIHEALGPLTNDLLLAQGPGQTPDRQITQRRLETLLKQQS